MAVTNKYSDGGPLKTFGWQMAKALFAALVVVIYSRAMGSFGRGALSVLLLYLQLTLMVSELVSGGALANLLAKYSPKRILPAAWGFLLLVLIVGYVVGWYFWLIPNQGLRPLDFDHPKVIILNLLFFQGLFLGALNIQYNLFQSKGLVQEKNQVQVLIEVLKLLGLTLLFLLMYGFLFFRNHRAMELSVWQAMESRLLPGQTMSYLRGFNETAVLWVLVYASGIAWLISLWKSRKLVLFNDDVSWMPPQEMFKSGMLSQLGHILLFLLYRLPLWWISSEFGNAAAGVLANALLIADTIWIFGNSFGTILHSRMLVLGAEKAQFGRLLSRYVWISGLGTFLAIVLAICVPFQCYTWVFGESFSCLKEDFFLISPAILFLGLSAPIGHFLHAKNKFGYLALSYGASVVMLLLGWHVLAPAIASSMIGSTPVNMGFALSYFWKMMAINLSFGLLFLLNYLQVRHMLKMRGISLIMWRFVRIRFMKK